MGPSGHGEPTKSANSANGERRSDFDVLTRSVTRHNHPERVKHLDDVVALASKSNTAYALKSDGTVWSWGDNRHGALGIHRTIEEWGALGFSRPEAQHAAVTAPRVAVAPLPVAGLSDVHAIACERRLRVCLEE